MKSFKIVIEETVAGEFEVNAETADEAIEIAKGKYKTGEFVLTSGEVHSKHIAAMHPEGTISQWREF